ncbi:MAG: caspase family protein, partial [Deltaproteobacteria bacterium]|nr:caspase family protein [Deltaproteobacteria bacterium]
MKRALLIGVGDAQVDAGPNLDAMAALLSELGWTSTRLEGRVATRERILAELATLEHAITSQPEPDDALFFYYFGHGGAIYFTDCPGPIGERPVFYLCSARPRGAWEALLDVELTHALASIDRLCGNVSAVLDCCHSAQVVRDVELPSKPAPEWVRELSETQAQRHSDDGLLALESHPTIARLTGASSLRLAYYDRTTKLGNLSAAFVAVVRAANEADLLARVTWG